MVTEAKPKEILELEKEIGKELTRVGLEEIIILKGENFSLLPEDEVNRYTLDGKGKVVGLCLAYNGIVDISFLENFTHLTHLELLGNQIKNLSPLQKLTNLTDLGISINQIQDISSLQKLINLINLSLLGNQIQDILPLKNLTNLTELNLSDNQIVDIPSLQNLTNLTKLYLSQNRIQDISLVQNLINLTELNLSDNQIVDISPLQSLTNLANLDLSSNKIEDLSPLQNLTNLVNLDLSSNKIEDLSPLQNLTNLVNLDLSSNKIEDLSPLQNLTNLVNLDLSSNQIKDVSLLQNLTNLTDLRLSNNPIADISLLQKLTDLTGLYLSDNQIVDISPLHKLTNLTSLDLSNNQIVDISPLHKLNNLTNLHLSNNQIVDISPLQKLNNLTNLDLSSNQIINILPLQNLTNLTGLSLSDNQIRDILFLQNLIHLTILQLFSNKIQDISPIQKLIHLRFLHLSNNQIQDISLDFLNQFPKLFALNLFNNPLKGIPKECLGSDEHSYCLYSLKNYLSKPREYIYEAKLLLLGEASAGKTSLMKKLLDPKVDLKQEESTHGINLETWEFPYTNPNNTPLNPDFNGMFKAHILDFGGQDILQHTHRYFMRDRSLYLLVVNARESENYDWDKWLRTIRFYGGSDVPIYIVFNNKEKELMNPQLEKKWKERFGISKVFHIDLKDDRNLDSLVDQVKLGLQSLQHIGKEKHLTDWLKIKDSLNEIKKDTIPIDEYLNICKGIGIYKEDAILAATLLDLLGNILYFSNDKLKDTIILRKEWATEAAYQVYWSKEITNNFGKFYRSELESILVDTEKFPLHQYDFLLNLMDQFGIAYQSKERGSEVFIVPARLKVDPPDNYQKCHTNQKRYFKLVLEDYMPRGILVLLIVRKNQLIYQNIQWKTGVVLNLQEELNDSQPTLAEIVEIYERNKQEITVVLSGAKPREAFSIVYRQHLQKIIQEIDTNQQLKPLLKVGCFCEKCKSLEEPYYFDYNSLLERQRENIPTAECGKSYKPQNVIELLSEFDLPSDADTLSKHYMLDNF